MSSISCPFRIGHGYDVHRLVAGRRLMLGGVDIPHMLGLLGHSDADVLLHAVMDAVLGALGEGDIGRHFPDTDSAYKDISSVLLSERVVKILKDKNFCVVNIDATILAQRPRLAPYLPEMCSNLARIYQIPQTAVNVKATTEERLGFTGQEEGIAVHAVVLLQNSK